MPGSKVVAYYCVQLRGADLFYTSKSLLFINRQGSGNNLLIVYLLIYLTILNENEIKKAKKKHMPQLLFMCSKLKRVDNSYLSLFIDKICISVSQVHTTISSQGLLYRWTEHWILTL